MHNSEHHNDLRDDVKPLSFGQRLREERDRLGLSQVELAGHGGVGRTTQHIYESDVRVPDLNYLERLREVGVDLGYLVLGTRQPTRNPDLLAISYLTLTNVYRVVDEFCVDADGKALPLEVRLRFFQMLCASLNNRGSGDGNLEALRSELSRFTGT